MYLAAAGVGRIGIVDFDVVDFSNLQRQLLHGTSDVGRSKLASAKDRLRDLNPHIADRHIRDDGDVGQRAAISSSRYDVILDGTDNFPTRYLVERRLRAAQASRTPTAASSGSKGRRRSSRPRTGRAIAACIPSRRRPGSCRAAPKAACWACCPASSASSRRPKRSS